MHPVAKMFLLVGLHLIPALAFAQTCAYQEPVQAPIFPTSTSTTLELRGFDQKSDPGAGKPFKKFLNEAWDGNSTITTTANNAAYLNMDNGAWVESLGIFTSYQKITIGGSWFFSADGATSPWQIDNFDQVPGPNSNKTSTAYDSTTNTTKVFDHEESDLEGIFVAPDPYLPPNAVYTETPATTTLTGEYKYIANDPLTTGLYGGNITTDVAIDMTETLSDEYTLATAASYQTPVIGTGSSPEAFASAFSRDWCNPDVGISGYDPQGPNLPNRMKPVRVTSQSVQFYAIFPSDGEDSFSPGDYQVTYHYKQWPVTQADPPAIANMTVDGGVVTFKDPPYYAPMKGPLAKFTLPVVAGCYTEIDYATAVPVNACPCQGTAGNGNGHDSSVDFQISLGNASNGVSAGQLFMSSPQVTSQLYTSAAWQPSITTSSDVQLVTDSSGNLLQVKTPNWLVDLVQTSSTVCDINFYQTSQITGPIAGTQRYPISGSPFVTYEAAEPTVDNGTNNQLTITEIRGAVVRQTTFANYTASTGTGVTMSLGPGYGTTRVSQSLGSSTAATTSDIIDDSGNVLSSTTTVYNVGNYGTVIASRSVSTGTSAPLLTQNTYYNNSATDGGAYGQLKQSLNPDGSWDYFIYDSMGRVSQHLKPFLNSPPSNSAATCQATTTTYSTVPDVDGDGVPETLIQSVQTILGTETGRSYRYEQSSAVDFNGDICQVVSSIVSTHPGAAWNAPSNLVTTTYTYSGGAFTGKTRAVFNSDGTATLTSLSLDGQGNLDTTERTGQLNGAKTDIIAGTMTVTVSSIASNTPTSVTTSDIATGLQLGFWTATQLDQWGRPLVLAYSDGTTDTRSYACCGLGSETDKEGITTSYNYDLAGRLLSTSRAGITTLNSYDAAGRVITVTRIGSDGSQTVTQTNVYDLAGRVVRNWDAVQRSTIFSQSIDSLGQTIRSTLKPDGGTEIRTNASDGSLLSDLGTAVAPSQFQYGVDSNGYYVKTIRVGSGNQTTEWLKSYQDIAGRPVSTNYPDGSSTQNIYNSLGQLAQTIDPDGVSTLYAYDGQGRQTTVAVDMDRNASIDASGSDRITSAVSQVTSDHGKVVQKTTTAVFSTNDSAATTTTSISEVSADGLNSWQTANGLTTASQISYAGGGLRIETSTAPDGTQTVSQFHNDLLVSTTVSQSTIGTVSSISYAYDPENRLQSSTDARNGTTNYSYFADDKLASVTTPPAGSGQSGPGYDPETTSYLYDLAGRVSQVTEPDGAVVSSIYYPTGLLQKTFGARTYPQEYSYDSQGRVLTLSTWKSFAGNTGQAVTTWNYEPSRGWLASKVYPDGNGPSYTYWPSGRLKTRTWARGVVTSYSYDNGGGLTSITYSDATPSVSMTYDRLGQIAATTDAAGLCNYTYDISGQLQNESYGSTGLLGGRSITRAFDSLDRLSSLSLAGGTSASYGYDGASRLQTVTNGSASVAYAYLPNSNLIGSITSTNSGSPTLTTTRAYDNMGRLSSTTAAPNNGSPQSYTYTYDAANLRTQLNREDGSYWQFGYDQLGQVTSANKALPSGTQLNGYGFTATFDDIGNRSSVTVNDQPFAYTSNALNEYTQRTVPGIVNVLGTASASSIVTANFQRAVQQGSNFYAGLVVNNLTAPQFLNLNIDGVLNNAGPNGEDALMQASRSSFVPKTPEIFAYDSDGNLTADGRWSYSWDGEDRLIAMQTIPAAAASGAPNQRITFVYDSQNRRIQKRVGNWSGGAYQVVSDIRFVYDGSNLIGESDGLNGGASLRAYTWGLDLSGSLQGAGGVGGLLEFSDINSGNSYFTGSDGNGNVVGLYSTSSGAFSAQYEYQAFGEPIQTSGASAVLNPIRFSSKYTDSETDSVYYGQRYYNPSTGRWLSRDPIGEQGGQNIYAAMSNDPINSVDALGESTWSTGVNYSIVDQVSDSEPLTAGVTRRHRPQLSCVGTEINVWFAVDVKTLSVAGIKRVFPGANASAVAAQELVDENQHVQDWLTWADSVGKPLVDDFEHRCSCHCSESALRSLKNILNLSQNEVQDLTISFWDHSVLGLPEPPTAPHKINANGAPGSTPTAPAIAVHLNDIRALLNKYKGQAACGN